MKFSRWIYTLTLSVMLACQGVEAGSYPDVNYLAQTVTFDCEADVLYKLESPAGWSAGTSSQIRLPFDSGSTDTRYMYCTYKKLGSSSVEATLIREVPAGHSCTYGGSKSRSFACTRKASPIKIKPTN